MRRIPPQISDKNTTPQISNEKVLEIMESDFFSQFFQDEKDSKTGSNKPLTPLDKPYIETFFDLINTVLEKFWTVPGDQIASVGEKNGEKTLKFLLLMWDKCAKGETSEHFNALPHDILNPHSLQTKNSEVEQSISSAIPYLNGVATCYIDLQNHNTDKKSPERRREAFAQILKICIEETVNELRIISKSGSTELHEALHSLEGQTTFQTILLEISRSRIDRNRGNNRTTASTSFPSAAAVQPQIPNPNPLSRETSAQSERGNRQLTPPPFNKDTCIIL